jgi:hypothetical protein
MEERFFRSLGTILHSPLAIRLLQFTRLFYQNRNPSWVECSRISLPIPNLPASFHGYRIIQISDLHLGTWLSVDKLDEIAEIVNHHAPDLVVITGDFVSFHPQDYQSALTNALLKLNSKDGILAVFGNHDHWTNAEIIRAALDRARVTELNNRAVHIQRGTDRIYIAGVDDHYAGKDRLDLVLSHIPENAVSILLAHEPDFAEISSAYGVFSLQLSGHSHGGQIVLPRMGALYLPHHGRKYPRGLYKIGDMYLYTNRGLGTAEFQIRYNCPPEITIFELLVESNKAL